MKYIKTIKLIIISFAILITSVNAGTNRVSSYTKTKINRDTKFLGLSVGSPVLIRTFKKESQLELWIKKSTGNEYLLFRTYPICKYSGRLGPKLKAGDHVTPEGFYSVTKKNLNSSSHFHLSFNLGYPNAYDRFHKRTGSLLMIHGACVSIGCYAMGNPQIEEIYYLIEKALNAGQPSVQVHAFPYKMTDSNLNKYKLNKWFGFWKQLKVGYDKFEKQQQDLNISIVSGKYEIN